MGSALRSSLRMHPCTRFFTDPMNGRVLQNVEKYEKLLVAASPPTAGGLRRPTSTYLRTRAAYERLCQTRGSQVFITMNPCTVNIWPQIRIFGIKRIFLSASPVWKAWTVLRLLYQRPPWAPAAAAKTRSAELAAAGDPLPRFCHWCRGWGH